MKVNNCGSINKGATQGTCDEKGKNRRGKHEKIKIEGIMGVKRERPKMMVI